MCPLGTDVVEETGLPDKTHSFTTSHEHLSRHLDQTADLFCSVGQTQGHGLDFHAGRCYVGVCFGVIGGAGC